MHDHNHRETLLSNSTNDTKTFIQTDSNITDQSINNNLNFSGNLTDWNHYTMMVRYIKVSQN